MGCGMRSFHEEEGEPGTALARLPTQALACAFAVARAHPRPGGQMTCGGKARHIQADLGENAFRRTSTDAWNGAKQRHSECPGKRRSLACLPGLLCWSLLLLAIGGPPVVLCRLLPRLLLLIHPCRDFVAAPTNPFIERIDLGEQLG